jgi:hypothetical protein
MYLNIGDKFPTPSSSDYIAEPMNLNGQSILVRSVDVGEFKPGMVLSISVEIPANAIIIISSESYHQ